MKYIAKLYGQAIVDTAKKMVCTWQNDHELYYGTPLGNTKILKGFEYLPVGFSQGSDVVILNSESGYRWLRASGEDHRISFDQDENGIYCLVGFSGKRKGMLDDFIELLREGAKRSYTIIYKTSKEGKHPWELYMFLDSQKKSIR